MSYNTQSQRQNKNKETEQLQETQWFKCTLKKSHFPKLKCTQNNINQRTLHLHWNQETTLVSYYQPLRLSSRYPTVRINWKKMPGIPPTPRCKGAKDISSCRQLVEGIWNNLANLLQLSIKELFFVLWMVIPLEPPGLFQGCFWEY